MATARKWSAVKADAVAAGLLDENKVREGARVLRQQVRSYRLAEIRRRQDFTQLRLSAETGVSQGRISQIETGSIDSAELGTLARYIEGLGGQLKVVADFGDEQLLVR